MITHSDILHELSELYEKKNYLYGDSFHLTFKEEGWAAVRIRLNDKVNRVNTITRAHNSLSNSTDETLRDNLLDLANYSILAIIEMGRLESEENRGE